MRGYRSGSGRGRGRGHGSSGRPPVPPVIGSERPLGELVTTLYLEKLSLEEEKEAPKITGCAYVASYNWLNETSPTILIPGTPPCWCPHTIPPRLSQDTGSYYRDVNSAHYPAFPTEPAIRALFEMVPDFNTRTVDVVACGSTLGNLLRFASGSERDFRFDIEIVGDTVFLIRRENSPKELIPNVRGYGHTFPEAYTTWDASARKSTSHQRVVEYDFSGMRFLVRSESDGYLKDLAKSGTADESTGSSSVSKQPEVAAGKKPDAADDVSSLTQATSSVTVGREPTPAPASPSSEVKIELSTPKVPQCSIFDLKTRSSTNPLSMTDDVLPRLWLNRTPNFILARHTAGTFSDIRVEDVSAQIASWEKDNADTLKRFAAVVEGIVEAARAMWRAKGQLGDRLEVVRVGGGPVGVHMQAGAARRVLPEELRARWAQIGIVHGGVPSKREKGRDYVI